MQEPFPNSPHSLHSLRRAVPGHLLQFEETIFGMSLMQLLTDLGMFGSFLALTGSLAWLPRLVLGVLVVMGTLVLVHGKVQGTPLGSWLLLWVRFLFLPTATVFRPSGTPAPKGEPASVQQTWLQLDALEHGVASIRTSRPGHQEPVVTAWVAFAVESLQEVRLLAADEQERLYARFQQFLDGLSFPVKLLSLVESVDAAHDVALHTQHTALTALATTPQLQQVQQVSLQHQCKVLAHCTTTRHIVVVAVSTHDLSRSHAQVAESSLLSRFLRLLLLKKPPRISREQVIHELAIRLSLLKKAFGQLEVQATQLDDVALLHLYASCLAPGASLPCVEPHALFQGTDVRDLIAPSAVSLHKEMVEVRVGQHCRYQRCYEVMGFAPALSCGWQEELTALGLPMTIMSRYHPIESHLMLKKLEVHLTKLESQRLADEKARRLTKTAQQVEAEQVRAVIAALARKQFTIFAVQMVLRIHAGSREHLEQRAHYLLSHLHDLHLRVRPLTWQQDRGWQSCLPADLTWMQSSTNLPSDVLATFMHWSRGVIGTPTGAYLGTTGTGAARHPVYFNPWERTKRLPNPHVVICGESGMGKSWLAKTLVLGLICANVADAVVLDRDGDYDALHDYLHGESQRFNLAGACPVNILDIPYGPADVSLDEPIDLLAECIDNHLLVGLALLYGDALSKAQEAVLTHAAREAYAAKGITSDAIRRDADTLLREPPVFADLLAALRHIPASSELLRQGLLERFEQVAYLFPGQTTITISSPLTIFNIHTLDEKWYPLMIYVVQNFLQRHRALRRDARYLAYVVEEASYLLKHPAGKRYLEQGSRGFRKLGIAQVTLSQHPADFLEEGQVILSNAGTCFFLGMQRHAAHKLHLTEELERVLEAGTPGRAVMRCGREYAILDIAKQSPLHRALLTTDPGERRVLHTQQTPTRQRRK